MNSTLYFLWLMTRASVLNEYSITSRERQSKPQKPEQFVYTWCFLSSVNDLKKFTQKKSILTFCRHLSGKLVFIKSFENIITSSSGYEYQLQKPVRCLYELLNKSKVYIFGCEEDKNSSSKHSCLNKMICKGYEYAPFIMLQSHHLRGISTTVCQCTIFGQ